MQKNNNKLKKILPFILFFGGLHLFIRFMDYIGDKGQVRLIMNDIKVDLRGEVTRKLALRGGSYTHVEIKRKKKMDTIVFFYGIDEIRIGDSLIKPSSYPFYYIKTKNKVLYKGVYVYIDDNSLEDKRFPQEWKEKCKTEWKDACK